MKVYHGSIIEVAHPLVSLGRRNLDLGKVFTLQTLKSKPKDGQNEWGEGSLLRRL